MHQQDEGPTGYACDRRNVAKKGEIEFLIKGRIDGVHRADQEKRIAVWRRFHDRFGCDIDAPTGSVLDDKLSAKPFREPVADKAGHNILRATWCRADNDAHRPHRIGLRSCNPR